MIIGPPDSLLALQHHTRPHGEVYTFTDSHAVEALDEITRRRPQVVALERLFAATSRGAALINRIKADPTLGSTEIRIVSPDTGQTRVSPRMPSEAAAPPVPAVVVPAQAVASAPPAPALDQRGTRRAPRVRARKGVEVLVDGNPAALVDLSAVGAQVVSATALRPNQRVRMTLPDAAHPVRFNGTIAWAAFELPKTPPSPVYRAGIQFTDADPHAVVAFAEKIKQ